jgi:hypothetical protein
MKFPFLNNFQSLSSAFRSHKRIGVTALLAATIALGSLIFSGSGTPVWWAKAPVAAAGIDSSRALITLENDHSARSSMVVVRANLSKEVTRLQVLPSYFDSLTVNGSQVLVAKRGIARAQCLNASTGEIHAPLGLPAGLRIAGGSATSSSEFLIWGRGPSGGTMIFNTNCTRLTLIATVKESLKLVCPVEKQLVAMDVLGSVFRANQFFQFEATNQKFRHLDLLTCGDAGIVGHLKNASGDFLTSIGPKSAVTQPLNNAKGVFALLFEQRDSKWFGLKHGKTTTSVSLFPIAL